MTSLLTAVAATYASRAMDMDIFTLSVWVVIPAGAIGVGFVAASGYYFASLWLHHRPTKALLLQMVVVAGLTQLLIYYLGYRTLDIGGGQLASDVVPFAKYLDIVLTTEHLQIGHANVDVGEVGGFGYGLAAIQFVGFLIGGLCLWTALRGRAACQGCHTYMRKLASRSKMFPDPAQASSYYDHILTHPVSSAEFADFIRAHSKVDKTRKGTVKILTALYGCPKCSVQLIDEKVTAFDGHRWGDLKKMDRRVPIPRGLDLRPVFAG